MNCSRILLSIVVLFSMLCGVTATNADPLRYGWKDGESYAYAVKISVQGHGYTEEMEGTSVFTARVAGQDTTLIAYGILVPLRKDRQGNLLDRTGPLTLGLFRLSLPNPGITIPLNALGEIFSGQGADRPGFALGSITRMILQPLPTRDRTTWTAENDCMLETPNLPDEEAETRAIPAHENFEYTRTGRKGSLVPIQIHYELRTRPGVVQGREVEITGDGPFRFNAQEGVPESLDFQARLKDSTGGQSAVWTIQYTFRALHGAELEMALHPSGASSQGTVILRAAELAQALADLRSPERWSRLEGANLLASAEPVTRRSEVAHSLRNLLRDPDAFVQRAAVRALGKWGTTENVRELLPFLDSPNFALRWTVIETLALIGDPRAAVPLARRVIDPNDRSEAGDALEALGPSATGATAALLTHQDWRVRLEACHILGSIGGPGAERALRTALRDANELVAAAAQNGLEEIAGAP